MLLPGPEALQLVIWLGWRWFGIAGGIVAGRCFLLPAVVLLAALSFVYALYGTLAPAIAVLAGLKAVVVALVGQAQLGIGRRALRGPRHLALAALAFVALAWLRVPFPLVIGAAALAGLAAQPRLAAALEAVTAAVVGVIGSFALAVALAVLLPVGIARPDWVAGAIAAISWLLLTRTRLDLVWVLALGALAGLVARGLGAG